MYVIVGIVVALAGLFMLLAPNAVYELTQNWKNYSDGDPSDWFLRSTRISGAIVLLAGVACVVIFIFNL